MSGPWYGLATLAIALVIRWLIYNDTGPSRLKPRKVVSGAQGAQQGQADQPDSGG